MRGRVEVIQLNGVKEEVCDKSSYVLAQGI